jgi:hypothetical protein
MSSIKDAVPATAASQAAIRLTLELGEALARAVAEACAELRAPRALAMAPWLLPRFSPGPALATEPVLPPGPPRHRLDRPSRNRRWRHRRRY